jgi:hypothetical protein
MPVIAVCTIFVPPMHASGTLTLQSWLNLALSGLTECHWLIAYRTFGMDCRMLNLLHQQRLNSSVTDVTPDSADRALKYTSKFILPLRGDLIAALLL